MITMIFKHMHKATKTVPGFGKLLKQQLDEKDSKLFV